MKKLCKIVVSILLIMPVFCACAKESSSKNDLPPYLPLLDTLRSTDKIAYAEYEESFRTNDPECIYSSESELNDLLAYLHKIKITKHCGTKAPQMDNPRDPKILSRYKFYKFDGTSVGILFESPIGEEFTKAPDTVIIDGEYYLYTEEQQLDCSEDLLLFTDWYHYPLNTQNILYTLYNYTDLPMSVQMHPSLEKMTETGWEEVPSDVGFCGNPIPFSNGMIQDVLDLSWYDDITSGTYRMTITCLEGDKTHNLSTVFHITN